MLPGMAVIVAGRAMPPWFIALIIVLSMLFSISLFISAYYLYPKSSSMGKKVWLVAILGEVGFLIVSIAMLIEMCAR
jgi:hypothetical protein